MTEKFSNRYRILSARMRNWDYGWNAPYFITICTKNRAYYFGEIIDGNMELSEIGKIALQYWMDIPTHFQFVHLGAFVVMPNHIHGVIIIDKPVVETPESGVSAKSSDSGVFTKSPTRHPNIQTPESGVSTELNTQTSAASKKWKPATLGVIINQYKRKVTLESRKTHLHFMWQPRFHDHIILNHESFFRIEKYILENPMKWMGDKFH